MADFSFAADFLVPASSSLRVGLGVTGLQQGNLCMTFLPGAMVYGGAFVGSELHISDQTVQCAGPTNNIIWYWATVTNPRPYAAQLMACLNTIS